MGYLSESSTWRQRRQRRQRITMTVVVLLVLAVGVAAFGYRQHWFDQPDDEVVVSALPTCPSASPPPLAPADVHVNVYNSTPRNGLAASVAKALGDRSFSVETVANDPLHANVSGTALVRYGTKGADAARLVSAQVPKATMKRDKRKGAEVDLVLGDAFRKLVVVSTATATSTTAPGPTPTCTPAPSASTPESGTASATTAG